MSENDSWQFHRPPIDFVKNSILKVEYLKKYKVYKHEKSLHPYRCMDLDLCDRWWVESIGLLVLATLIAQIKFGVKNNNGKGKSRLWIPMHNNNRKGISRLFIYMHNNTHMYAHTQDFLRGLAMKIENLRLA